MRNKMMTLKMLKRKIAELEADRIVDDNTVICGYNDEFCHLYALEESHQIVKDVSEEIQELEESIEYLKSCNSENFESINKRIAEKEQDINRLKSFGKNVICLV